MKKRLSKLALLAVAAAFVLVGFPACGDDDDGGEPPAEASATFAGVEIPEGGLALTAGTPQDVTATLTVANSAFSDAVKALEVDADISEYITLTAGEKVSIADVKVAETANDTTMKITFTVAAEDGAESGTITATLKAAALTADKDVAATGTISYTVTAADPNAPKATFTGDNVPADGVALTMGEEKTGNATIAVTNGTFSDAVKALNVGDAIPDTLLALNAGGKVTVSDVKVATKANDTTIEITLTMTAGNDAGTGAIKATLKADALKDYNKAVAASGSIAFTVKDNSKPDETVYFTSFVASKDLDKAADSTAYETLTSKDGLVTMGRTKYQIPNDPYTTIDYDEEAGSGYTYTARVKVNKASGNDKGTLTIKSVKVGDILRFDGGNGSGNGDVRKMNITGADETVWEATTYGSFYLTATAETVVLESMTNEFCIYGIHVVDEKAEKRVVKEEMTYVAPVVTLSATSVVKGEEVTITTTIPSVTKTTTYSTGTVSSESMPVTADITYNGATVADSKVDTSAERTLTITASYTVDGEMYTSEPVTLEVTEAFTEQTAEVANNENTLGLVATGAATTDNENVAMAEVNENNIVISSKAKGTATITVSDGTKTATIDVTVKANGGIETTVKPYSSATEDGWNFVLAKTGTGDAAGYFYKEIKFVPGTNIAASTILSGTSEILNIEITGAKFQLNSTETKIPYGILVKNTPITIKSVKGNVTLTVNWGTESKTDRSLTVQIGSANAISTAATGKNIKTEFEVFTRSFDAGEGTDVIIGASNDSYIKSITIEAQK